MVSLNLGNGVWIGLGIFVYHEVIWLLLNGPYVYIDVNGLCGEHKIQVGAAAAQSRRHTPASCGRRAARAAPHALPRGSGVQDVPRAVP